VLLFARVKKKSKAPEHVTATTLIEDKAGKYIYVYRARNNGLQDDDESSAANCG
jgi:hypothetical protein